MANAPVLKTGGRKALGVRIPRPPLDLRPCTRRAVVVLEGFWKVALVSAGRRRVGLPEVPTYPPDVS
jgi:hypothetical protein